MSRPKKPEDPAAWPACARCGKHYEPTASWPEGRVCGYCYMAAKRVTGVCACGHRGVLPGLDAGRSSCRACSGIWINVDCRSCGEEAELYVGGKCWSCHLSGVVDRLLTDPATGRIAPTLTPVAVALKTMPRANSGLTWINQPHVTAFLTDLATAAEISHESLDTVPASRTRDYVRGLLVEHGALPRRDELRARYTVWAAAALERMPEAEDRDVIRRYIRWHHQRRMNQMDQVSQGTFLRAKQTVTVAIEFLLWLRSNNRRLDTLTQADLDHWQSTGPTTREISSRCLGWAITAKLVDRDLSMTPHRRGTSPKSSADEQDPALQQVVHGAELIPATASPASWSWSSANRWKTSPASPGPTSPSPTCWTPSPLVQAAPSHYHPHSTDHYVTSPRNPDTDRPRPTAIISGSSAEVPPAGTWRPHTCGPGSGTWPPSAPPAWARCTS